MNKILLTTSLLIIAGLIGSVNAEQYRVDFTGEVHRVGIELFGVHYNNLGDTILNGDIISGSFIYDDSISDVNTSVTYGIYPDAVSDFSIIIYNSSSTILLDTGKNSGNLSVYNDAWNNPADVFLASSNRPEIVSVISTKINNESLTKYQFGLVSYDEETTFSSDAVPSNFELNAFPTLTSSNGVNWMQFTADNASFDVSNVTNQSSMTQDMVYRLSSQIRWKLTNITATKTTQTPEEAVKDLVAIVENLNFEFGLSNSLDSKLKSVLNVVEDLNENNDVAAINSLYAFINGVEAQRGKSIPDEDADILIEAALAIIDALEGI